MESKQLKGHFLISDTELQDPNFFRTVVLIISHDETGALGLVVNRSAQACLGDAIPEMEEYTAGEVPLFIGGPVQPEYLFVLREEIEKCPESDHLIRPVPGVVFEPLTEELIAYLIGYWQENKPKGQIRIFAGYSGWIAGQLEKEIAINSWFLHQGTPEIVFHPNPEKGWMDALSKKGPFYQYVAETGVKPSIN